MFALLVTIHVLSVELTLPKPTLGRTEASMDVSSDEFVNEWKIRAEPSEEQ